MKDIYKKIIISLSAFILVLSFMFTNISIQNRSVSIRFNDNQFTSVNAGFRETAIAVIAIIAYNVYLSMTANEVAPGVQMTLEQFTSWYIDWYTDNTNEAQLKRANEGTEADWQSQQEMLDYLMATQQINELGQLQTEDAVLKKEYLFSLSRTSTYLTNEFIDTGWIKWYKYNFANDKTFVFPVINGVESIRTNQIYGISYSLNDTYFIDPYYVKHNIEVITKGINVYRLKLSTFDNSGNLIQTMYTLDLDTLRLNELINNNGYLLTVKKNPSASSRFHYFIPLKNNLTLNESNSLGIFFSSPDVLSNSYLSSTNRVNYDTGTGYIPNSDFISFNDQLSYEIPTSLLNNLEDSNYYVVPGTTVTTPTLPTPLPEDQEDDYIWSPTPTDPVIPDVDIGEGMPLTPGVDEINDPVLSVPLPGLDDLLDGTYFKDIVVWFTAWLTLTISNATNFWNTAWSNLTTGINWLGDVIVDVGKNLRDSLLFPLNAIKTTLDLFRSEVASKELDLADYFVVDLALTQSKLNLLIAKITARIPCVNETFQAWADIMAVQAHDLVSEVTVLGNTFTINTGEILQAFSGFGNWIKQAFRFVFWFIFLKGMRRRVTSFLGLVSTER